MRRYIAGLTVLGGIATLLAMPLASSSQPPNVAEDLKNGVNKTLDNVRAITDRLSEEERKRREREAARRAAARNGVTPRAAAPDPNGQGYNPPLHGSNPHGQGTPTTVDVPASTGRPLPNTPAGGAASPNSEILVVGRSRGEQNPDGGTYHGHVTIAALGGQDVIPPLDTNPGQNARSAPLASVLDQVCTNTGSQICLGLLEANSATTGSGSTNNFSAATADVGAASGGGISADAVQSNGNISQDANCQTAHGDSRVANANVGGGLRADAIDSASDSRQCKDGSQTQTNTGRVLNLNGTAVALGTVIPPGCGNGDPNVPALLPLVLTAICNATESNAAQALAPYGVREGLTTFVLPVAGQAGVKLTTAASESRAFIRAQCSDGIDNDGDGRIDFPNDPDCTGPTDDSEAGARRAVRDDDDDRDRRRRAECEDGRDNDGDGRVDFPDDPGCTSRSDDSEANAGAGAAGAGGGRGGATECSDGIDNDGDGKVDYPNDPGCSSASDDSERNGGNALAFTGTNLVLMFLIGSLVLLAGLRIRAITDRRHGNRAQRAGMA